MPERLTYIVVPNTRSGATAEDLQRCVDAIQNDPNITIKNIVRQRQDATVLQRLLIEATPQSVNGLRETFQNRLIIEQDQPLNLLRGPGPLS